MLINPNKLPRRSCNTSQAWGLLIVAFFASASLGEAPAKPVDFNSEIRPIFTQYCLACHGGVKQAGDLSFVYAENVLPPDGWVIEPGDAEASILIERLRSTDPDERMPPPEEHPNPVPADKIALMERWIDEGANWGSLWAYSPLAAVEPPNANDWGRLPMDAFVAGRWAEFELAGTADAPPAEWLRRATFDLTGLPPTPKQTQTFVNACSQATTQEALESVYEQNVDALLASEHFGERWASLWMDLARYADSKGFEKDPHRDMWPYRDWLIRAFNSDMPYDEFTVKQLAGDLRPSPTADDWIATAFHRNTQTNTEGGTDDEEFRVAAIIDRVNTTWTVWQGTTFGCVQCHSHPYDPIKHAEYYASLALFNDTVDADLDDDYPTLKIPRDPEQWGAAIASQRELAVLRETRNQIGWKACKDAEWTSATPNTTRSTGGQLKIDGDYVQADGGTFPVGVQYTIEAKAAAASAIRIEILPEDSELAVPERGSVLSHLELSMISPDSQVTSVPLADVFVDVIYGANDPRDALNKSSTGVGEYPRLNGPREAYFVLKEPIAPVAETRFRFTMTQSASTTGNVATPLRNFRISICDDPRLNELLSSEELIAANGALKEKGDEVAKIQGAELPFIEQRPADAHRSTRLFIRGNWLERGDEVAPGIPGEFRAQESTVVADRLDFARWLVSDANPLAARVWANRIWAQLFGLGLVETQEDFGSSGLPPSHPDLLDHLADRLRKKHRWHLKPFLRDLLLSSTYRQSNVTNAETLRKDPRNQWLARGPRTRLSAEMIRDQALAVSGLLSSEIGGPSVMPSQPEGVWQTVYSGAQWKTSAGGDRYRRAVYTYWRRTSPYPSLLTFDSPTRDLCSARRVATNTPLQALVTLNDPVYVECAQALASQAIANSNDSCEQMVSWMYEAVTQQKPRKREVAELVSLYSDIQNTEAGSEIDSNAMAIVASTLLNLDKALTK